MRNKKDMVDFIAIKNYKSVVEVEAYLGRFNLLVGENGCGKSNILEAITYGSAGAFDKLDSGSLALKGIRVTDPQFMLSAFDKQKNEIVFVFDINGNLIYTHIYPLGFKNRGVSSFSLFQEEDTAPLTGFRVAKENGEIIKELQDSVLQSIKDNGNLNLNFKEAANVAELEQFQELKDFMFYCPEESALRTFQSDIQIYPLGRRGEGLFKYLKDLSKTEAGQKTLQEINENMMLLDWFDTIDIPKNTASIDPTVNIRDRYISDTLQYFDQRSTNEGFLFLLFYLTLFISKDTPKFFAIDNLESSFNPKLCTKVTELLVSLAKKYDKQVIVTTHSPFILDGLDLSDKEQKLLVVRRNDEGHTKVREIEYKAERTKKLSELWMSGAIGGLPDNF